MRKIVNVLKLKENRDCMFILAAVLIVRSTSYTFFRWGTVGITESHCCHCPSEEFCAIYLLGLPSSASIHMQLHN